MLWLLQALLGLHPKVSPEGTAETTAQGLVVEVEVGNCACVQKSGSIVGEPEKNAGGSGGVEGGSEWRVRRLRCMNVVVFWVHLTGPHYPKGRE